jgi:hypothetical protein
MLFVTSTLPLLDDTKGFRFVIKLRLGKFRFEKTTLFRLRKFKSNGFRFVSGRTFNQLHMGKFTIAVQRKRVKKKDKLGHFAG